MQTTWGLMPKSQIDPETPEEAITRVVGDHNDDPDAHLAEGQSLTSHRASEIIDHLAQSIVNDKIISIARAYTAILKIPTLQAENYFFSDINYEEPSLTVINSALTKAEIFGRVDSGDDSQYVRMDTAPDGYNYFLTSAPVLPIGKKLYKIKLKARLKIDNATVATMDVRWQYADGYEEWFTITNAWADYEFTLYHLMDSDDYWKIINQETLDAYSINLGSDAPTGDLTKNQCAISKFYIEGYAPIDVDQEDFFDFKDACDYVESLGGGSIFIKNGTYNTGLTKSWLPSYVEIIGESMAGVILNCSDPDDNLILGEYTAVQYSAGTMTLTQNSTTVAFAGVTVTSVKTVGKYLLNRATGHFHKIVAWIDNTHVTIEDAFQGATTASLTYLIIGMLTENKISNVTMNFEVKCQNILNLTFQNCSFHNGAFRLAYAENMQMIDCDYINVTTSVTFDYVSNSKWINNTFKNNAYTCIYLKLTSPGNIVADNLFIDNKSQCVLLFGFNNIVKGNTLLNNGWTNGQLYPPILTGSTSYKNIITGNICRNNNSYGIGSANGANYNIVANNICTDNYSAGVVNNGANSVTADNIV